jgi:AcrR family transcriptional regulator
VQETTANRHAILVRAVEFFGLKGYEKTTLQAVAESVGLTRAGLLHHFPSKESLFLQAIEESRHWAEMQARKRGQLRGLAAIRALSGFLGSTEDATWIRFAQILQAEALHDDATEALVEFVRKRSAQIQLNLEARLREARDDGEIEDLDIAALARTISATINGLQAQWLLDPSVDTSAAFSVLTQALTSGAKQRPPGRASSTG